MGLIFDNFEKDIKELWQIAKQIKHKPIHKKITWTCGFVSAAGHGFLDLQAHALAMTSSLIITENVVPQIICSWDTPKHFIDKQQLKDKKTFYPIWLMNNLGLDTNKIFKENIENFFNINKEYYNINTKYFKLIRHFHSCNTFPLSLGLGYRSKYHGLDYVKTPYGIMVDTDTISLDSCCPYIMSQINKNPDSFCWTVAYKEHLKQMNVGLVAFNMNKYRNIYQPHFNEYYWELPGGDVYWMANVFNKYPELKEKLKIELFDDYELLSTGKFKKYVMFNNTITFKENKTLHYHASKIDYKKNKDRFINFFRNILNNLKEKGLKQIGK